MNKILNRAIKNIKLTQEEWDSFQKELQEGVNKKELCIKYKLKNGYYKVLKRYFMGSK